MSDSDQELPRGPDTEVVPSQVGFMRKGCALVKLAHFHTFSAFWLRSSVVSVLISLISDTRCIASFEINSISHPGLLNRLLAA